MKKNALTTSARQNRPGARTQARRNAPGARTQVLRNAPGARTTLAILLAAALWAALLSAAALPLPACAAENGAAENGTGATSEPVAWTEDYYRATDSSGELTEAQQVELDASCIQFMKDFHADLAFLAITSDRLEGMTVEDAARQYYDECGFGYGEGRDGFQVFLLLDTNEVRIVPIGTSQTLVPQDYLDFVEESATDFREKYGVFGPFYVTQKFLRDYIEKHPDDSAEAAAEAIEETTGETVEVTGDTAETAENSSETMGDPSARGGEGSDKPAWYPMYPSAFPKYHDEAAPRVVDVADLFTGDEEQQMEVRLSEIRQELQKDIVIFTDVSTYGLEREIYAADFYDFNGYGIGDDYEGVILFICMDPNDRGWWAACTGPQTMAVYTEEVANQIDDLLYEYMSAGDYYAGVADWIENFRRIYLTGSPYLSEWTNTDLSTFERFHDTEKARIVDEIGILTESEIALLSEHAQQLTEKYGQDVVVHTALSSGPMDAQEYANLYYCLNGYGLGDEYEGIQLTVFKRPGYIAHAHVNGYGASAQKLTDVNSKRLENRCEGLLESGEFYEGIDEWISQTDHMLRTGRAPQSKLHWILSWIFSLIAGVIYAAVSLVRAIGNMDTPEVAENANAYYVPDSLKMRRVSDTFLHETTSKKYSPPPKRSSGGGSSGGGRSSYSSSYKGSSGTTHSGSGRNF